MNADCRTYQIVRVTTTTADRALEEIVYRDLPRAYGLRWVRDRNRSADSDHYYRLRPQTD